MIMYKLHFSDYKPKLLKIDSTASSKEFIYHVDKDDKLISELKEGWAETKEKAIEIALYRSWNEIYLRQEQLEYAIQVDKEFKKFRSNYYETTKHT